MKKLSRTGAFTLIELLVVIAIVAILAAILFPVFAQAKQAAKVASDLSNMKQLDLGLMLYSNDYDDMTPMYRVLPTTSDWWTANTLSWKDFTSPYIKSGGRAYNNGVPYTTPGSGGIYQSPIADAPWSDVSPLNWVWPPAQGPGDETTRFPRGYEINYEAGADENNNPNNPLVAQWDGNVFFGTVGSMTAFSNPASTIYLGDSRIYFVDVVADYLGYQCNSNGDPTNPSSLSCVQGNKNHQTTVAFFDGHVKTVSPGQSVATDMWDSIKANENAAPGYTQALEQAISAIPEWTQ